MTDYMLRGGETLRTGDSGLREQLYVLQVLYLFTSSQKTTNYKYQNIYSELQPVTYEN